MNSAGRMLDETTLGAATNASTWAVCDAKISGRSVDFKGSEGDRIAAIDCREGILAVEASKASCPNGDKV